MGRLNWSLSKNIRSCLPFAYAQAHHKDRWVWKTPQNVGIKAKRIHFWKLHWVGVTVKKYWKHKTKRIFGKVKNWLFGIAWGMGTSEWFTWEKTFKQRNFKSRKKTLDTFSTKFIKSQQIRDPAEGKIPRLKLRLPKSIDWNDEGERGSCWIPFRKINWQFLSILQENYFVRLQFKTLSSWKHSKSLWNERVCVNLSK